MIRINLRDYYPFYKSDFFIEVTEEIAELLNSLIERNMQTSSVSVSTRHITPLKLATVLKRISFCWFYRRMKSMKES